MVNKVQNRRGLALVELSVLIVIIGFLIGGIIIGKSLIRASDISFILKQHDIFNSAVTAFKDKYNCLPTDCKNWAALGFIQDSNDYHKGDGIIDGDEKIFFWDVLLKAKLIDSVGANIYLPKIAESAVGNKGRWDLWSPKDSKITNSGDGTYTALEGKNYYWLRGDVEMFSFPYSSAAIFLPEDAKDIDIKIDDGLPFRGIVQASGDSYGYKYGNADDPGDGPWTPVISIEGITEDRGCVKKANNYNAIEQYNISNKIRTPANLCSLLIKTDF